jgi:hypothetical protein|tara:strand:+ start:2468 stop:2641 length:174 start_codon:yes stop_codon:yes gene_type:complete
LNKESKETDMIDHSIESTWETSEVSWDKIQRMRFMNADSEIAPNDKYTQEAIKKNET